jgi:hypothetical protein
LGFGASVVALADKRVLEFGFGLAEHLVAGFGGRESGEILDLLL